MKSYRALVWGVGLGIYLCMGGQVYLLHRMGALTLSSALPLHLCSFCGLITLPVLLTRCLSGWEFLLFLGLPGAAGALMFPCIVPCPWQGWMNFFFLTFHALLVPAPLLPFMIGMRPRRRPWGLLLWGNGLLLAALTANRLLNANFLFLQSGPAGTPLAFLHQWGPGVYLLLLESLAFLMVYIPR